MSATGTKVSHSALSVDVADVVVASGYFWKKGSAIRSWRLRQYKIRPDGVLTYYTVNGDAVKGTFNIVKIKISAGPIENIWELESEAVPQDSAVAFDIYSYNDIRTLEVVFYTPEDGRALLLGLRKTTALSNVKAFLEEYESLHFGTTSSNNPKGALSGRDEDNQNAPDAIQSIDSMNQPAGSVIMHQNSRSLSIVHAAEYLTVMEGSLLKLGHIRKGWKKRYFRLRESKNPNRISKRIPGLLEFWSLFSGGMIGTFFLGALHVKLDFTKYRGSVVISMVDKGSYINVPASVMRRVTDLDVIISADGIKVCTPATRSSPAGSTGVASSQSAEASKESADNMATMTSRSPEPSKGNGSASSTGSPGAPTTPASAGTTSFSHLEPHVVEFLELIGKLSLESNVEVSISICVFFLCDVVFTS
jgi:hypothetical protein